MCGASPGGRDHRVASCLPLASWCLRVRGRACVCERENLLTQEHIGSPGVVGCSLRGTRVPDVPRNVTAGGFGNLSRAFPAFREAFFLASLATCDLVHLKLGD